MWHGKSQFTVIEITKFRFLGKWPDNSLDIYDWMLLQVFLKKNGQKWLRRRQCTLRRWQWSVLPLRHCRGSYNGPYCLHCGTQQSSVAAWPIISFGDRFLPAVWLPHFHLRLVIRYLLHDFREYYIPFCCWCWVGFRGCRPSTWTISSSVAWGNGRFHGQLDELAIMGEWERGSVAATRLTASGLGKLWLAPDLARLTAGSQSGVAVWLESQLRVDSSLKLKLNLDNLPFSSSSIRP